MAFVSAQFRLSERTACKLLRVERSSYRYEPRPDRNIALREELAKLARQKPRYGYRRLHALLERRGHEVNVRLLRRSCCFMLLYKFGTQFTQNKEVVFYLLERGQYGLAIVGDGGVITCSCRLRSGPT